MVILGVRFMKRQLAALTTGLFIIGCGAKPAPAPPPPPPPPQAAPAPKPCDTKIIDPADNPDAADAKVTSSGEGTATP